MECREYQKLIQEYVDQELSARNEIMIFTHMAQCSRCRSFLKSVNRLNLSAKYTQLDFPVELEERIENTIEQRKLRKNLYDGKISSFLPYAMGTVIIALLVILYASFRYYHSGLNEALEKINKQDQHIQMIMNGYQEIQIKPKFTNEITIHAKL